MTYAVFDLETTTHTSYKRKANPFDPANRIVMVGYKKRGGDLHGEYFGRSGETPGWFQTLLQGTSMLVGHNIKFDLLYALRSKANLESWMDWVAAGGMVWDTQLAEYLLRGMVRESHMVSLDDVAPIYGGNLKFDEVKALWAAGVDTADIDPNLLRRYLLGAEVDGQWEDGDIGNTERVFLGQVADARKHNQLKSIMMNMGSLLCSIEMERCGMAVDKERGLQLAEELAAELAATKAELETHLPKDLPFTFNWGSRNQLSALLFGGSVKYTARVPVIEDGEQVYAQKKETHYVLEDGSTMSCLWYEHCLHTEWGGTEPPSKVRVQYGSGKNKGEYKTKQVTVPDLDKPKFRNEEFYYTFPGYTTPNKKWESAATPGVYSTAADVISELGNRGIPFLKLLARSSQLTKDLGTYYITTHPETGEQNGMLTLVQPDGIIHHSINHTSTVTGRFSSSNPNLQNIPKEGKSLVKTVFVSRFPGGKIIQSDFTALEVYVQAVLTECRQLTVDLIKGLDMHCVRVSQSEGMDYDEVYRLAKVECVPEWDKKRTKAKVFSFQRAYGAGAKTIAESTGMSVEEVETLIKAEAERYPEIDAYYERITEEIKRNRKPTSRFVQHPDIRSVNVQLGRSWFRTPDNKKYCYDEQPSPEYLAKRGQYASFSPTEIRNYVVQGTGGEWAKAAMWLVVREFYRHRNFDHRACLVNQVHDAVYVDAHPDVAQQAATVLHACMESASDLMEWWFQWPVAVPVPSDTVMGDNMMDEGKVQLGDVASLRAELRNRYMQGYTPSFISGAAQ